MSDTNKMADDEAISPTWKEHLEKLFVAIQTSNSDEALRLLIEVDAWLNCVADTDEDKLREELRETFGDEFLADVRSVARGELRTNSDTLTVCMINHLCDVVLLTRGISV